jgi:glycosyltransferase involved in cell wall biosynthesis
MKTILLLAYQISPTKGSEYAVGWNFLINLAKNNKVFVLTGVSGDHMGDTKEIEEYFKDNPHPNINLIVVKPTRLANLINWPNRVGIIGPIFYLAFPFWQKLAYKIAKEIVVREEIDVVHQLNPIGFREPGYLWKLNKPFIWGPVGGAIFVNPVLMKSLPLTSKFFFFIKNRINSFQLKYNQRIRKAADKASEIVFCNTENKENFERYLGKTGQIISEQGVFYSNKIKIDTNMGCNEKLNLVWAGQISYRKNLFLLFRSLSLITNSTKWVVNIIGDGPGVRELKDLANELSISNNIIWHGRITRHETILIMGRSDLHCMTSLGEGNPAVLYEAISLGVPTISLDRDGMHDTLANDNGILIPISSYDETIEQYAKKIDSLIENPTFLEDLKERTNIMAEQVTWEKKIQKFEEIYENAINDL